MEPMTANPKKDQPINLPIHLQSERATNPNDKATTTAALSARDNIISDSEPKKSMQEHLK